MKTKAQLIAQCKAENPTMVQTVNGEEIELTGPDYNTACEAWAEMQLTQQANQAEVEAKASEKAALLSRLGITEEEATLLLG